MSLPPLVPLVTVQSELAASLPDDTSALSACLDAASRQVRQYCKRDFTQTDYVELLDGRGFSEVITRQYPVNSVARLSVSPTTILSISNADSVGNVRATVAPVVTGDGYTGLIMTGIVLNRVSGGATISATLAFADYPTLTVLTGAVNLLGGGWNAKVVGNYGGWPTDDFLPNTGAQNALGNGSADFQVFTQDVSAYDVDPPTGKIRLRNQTFDPVFALMNLANTSFLSVFPLGFRSVRVEYNAGFATIPEGVQQATLMTVQAMLYDLQRVPLYQSETQEQWSATIAGMERSGLPDAAKRLLQPWRSFRQM